MERITIRTTKPMEVIDITDRVEQIVAKTGINEGICLVYVPHATSTVIINENESNLRKDFLKFFEQLVPKGNWAHNTIDDNAEAHLKSAFFGQGRVLPISNGKLARGTWQQIMLCEFDGPREREVIVLCK